MLISADGSTIGLDAVENLDGQNSQGVNIRIWCCSCCWCNNNFINFLLLKVTKEFFNLRRSGLYSKLPKRNISTVDLSNSNLTITRQAKIVL